MKLLSPKLNTNSTNMASRIALMLALFATLSFSCTNENKNPIAPKAGGTKVDSIIQLFQTNPDDPKIKELFYTLDSTDLEEFKDKMKALKSNLKKKLEQQKIELSIKNNHLTGQGTNTELEALKKTASAQLLTVENEKNKLLQLLHSFVAESRDQYNITTTFDEYVVTQADSYIQLNYPIGLNSDEQILTTIINDFSTNRQYEKNGDLNETTILNALTVKAGDCDIQSTSMLYIIEAFQRKGLLSNIVAILVPGNVSQGSISTKGNYQFRKDANHTRIALVIKTNSGLKILTIDPVNVY